MKTSLKAFTDLSAIADSIEPPTVGRISDWANMDYKTCLVIGNYWEDVAVQWFRENGYEASRPRQRFGNIYDYPKHQRDIDLYLKDREFHIEVKSRLNPWTYDQVDIGKTRSWDAKQFPVSAIVVIDQKTARAAIAPAGDLPETDIDPVDRYVRAGWQVRQNRDLSYSVPKELFRPLEELLDLLEIDP